MKNTGPFLARRAVPFSLGRIDVIDTPAMVEEKPAVLELGPAGIVLSRVSNVTKVEAETHDDR